MVLRRLFPRYRTRQERQRDAFERAFQREIAAFKADQSTIANPYEKKAFRDAWHAGWEWARLEEWYGDTND